MPRSFALCALLLLTGLAAGAAAPPPARKAHAVQVIRDVAYHNGADHDPVRHKLDLYLPKNTKEYPVVLFVHGGAWFHGSKDFLGFYGMLGRSLAREGIGVAVTNYRLSPWVKHPEHVKDVARAFAWTAKNIGKHGGDPDRLFLCGHSAGGHLVSLLAVDDSYLKEVGLTRRAIRGVVPISGVYVFPNDRFLPQVFGNDPERTRKAAPLAHAREGLPPFLILWADRDLALCGAKTSERFASALKAKGNDVRALEVRDANHYTIILQSALDGTEVSKAVRGFIRANSRGKEP